MSLIEINRNPTPRELRQFAGIWFPLLWGFVGTIVWVRAGQHVAAIVVWATAAVVAVAGVIRPRLIRPVFVGMCMATAPIGYAVSFVLIAAVYYLILTPTGLVLRLFHYDPMQKRFDRGASSYWVERKASGDVKRYFRQF